MKKVYFLAAVLLLGACENMSQYTTASADASPRQKMQACMLNEANTRLYNGTLFVNTVSEESQTAAVNIINNLKTLSNN